MKSSHSRRLERLRALQASYNVLKEQVKTYDAQERYHSTAIKIRYYIMSASHK